jgi:hypothetical protein
MKYKSNHKVITCFTFLSSSFIYTVHQKYSDKNSKNNIEEKKLSRSVKT